MHLDHTNLFSGRRHLKIPPDGRISVKVFMSSGSGDTDRLHPSIRTLTLQSDTTADTTWCPSCRSTGTETTSSPARTSDMSTQICSMPVSPLLLFVVTGTDYYKVLGLCFHFQIRGWWNPCILIWRSCRICGHGCCSQGSSGGWRQQPRPLPSSWREDASPGCLWRGGKPSSLKGFPFSGTETRTKGTIRRPFEYPALP